MALLNELSDDELTLLLAKGDQSAFNEIYHRYKGPLYVHAYNRLRNAEEVHDMIHELFANLWSRRESIAFSSSLSAYLYTAIRNRILDFFSHQQVESAYVSAFQNFLDSGAQPSDYLVREKQLAQLIEKEIALLPEKMRMVFELSRKEHLSHQEIADLLDISDKTVKKHINNALKILRLRLGVIVYITLLLKIHKF